MKKKLALAATAVALGALVVVGATMAYFTSQDTATNVITTGKIVVTVKEEEFQKIASSTTDETTHIITSTLEGIMPNEKINKDPVFKLGDGSADAYIRVAIDAKVLKTDGSEENLDAIEQLKAELSGENWEKKGDYYYYIEKITTQTEGVALFKTQNADGKSYTILIPADWTNDYQDAKINMDIKVEAIQADNFTPDFTAADPWNGVTVE